MSEKYDELALRDFVAWVKYRNPHGLKIDSKTLEYVAHGIEQFLENKTPWKKPKGNKPKPELMWECYSLAYFTVRNDPYKNLRNKRHVEEGGLYEAIGKTLNLSAQAVLSHEINAKKLCETVEGRVQYSKWLAEKHGYTYVRSIPNNGSEEYKKLREQFDKENSDV